MNVYDDIAEIFGTFLEENETYSLFINDLEKRGKIDIKSLIKIIGVLAKHIEQLEKPKL